MSLDELNVSWVLFTLLFNTSLDITIGVLTSELMEADKLVFVCVFVMFYLYASMVVQLGKCFFFYYQYNVTLLVVCVHICGGRTQDALAN